MTSTANDALTPETELALVPGIRTRNRPDGHVLIETPSGAIVDAGPDGFEIVTMFASGRTLGDAVDELQRRSDPIRAAGVVMHLIETGALLDASTIGIRHAWSDPVEHAWMLHDHRRTDAYLAAVRDVVQPGDVVLDIGTGSGILAVAAARAGARRVFAIEASDIATTAAAVFEANGVADRITVIRGWSADVAVPEPADVLVSEIIGAEPLDEEILETTLDARRRLLRPDARLIPSSLHLFAQPLSVPDDDRWARTLGRDAISDLERRYDLDLTPLFEARDRHAVHWPTDDRAAAGWTSLGDAAELVALDLATLESPAVRGAAELTTDRGGFADAILVTFRARLAETVELTHRPRIDERSSWSSSVWFLPERIEVRAGDRLSVSYSRRVAGEPDGLTCTVAD